MRLQKSSKPDFRLIWWFSRNFRRPQDMFRAARSYEIKITAWQRVNRAERTASSNCMCQVFWWILMMSHPAGITTWSVLIPWEFITPLTSATTIDEQRQVMESQAEVLSSVSYSGCQFGTGGKRRCSHMQATHHTPAGQAPGARGQGTQHCAVAGLTCPQVARPRHYT